jgi:hypothetical protein
LGDSIATDNVIEYELGYLFTCDIGKGNNLNPFSEVLSSSNDILVTVGGVRKYLAN